jgi:AcrR family transcriptional regulator
VGVVVAERGESERAGRALLPRARMIDAAAQLAAEQGFAGLTVARVCARARVSRPTFQREFSDVRDCFLAVIDEGHRRADGLICAAFAQESDWLDGIRRALAAVLLALDEDPAMTRAWFVETLAAGCWALERRERHIRALTETIVTRWPLPPHAQVSPLAADAVMESALGALRTRLLSGRREPMIELLGPLMSFIASLYLDARHAEAEHERSNVLTRAMLASRGPRGGVEGKRPAIPAMLRDPRAHRARQCLLHLAEHPGASNWQVATATGISRQSQVSRLLARLEGQGLVRKREGLLGRPNAWSLTRLGAHAARELTNEHERVTAVIAIDS